MIVMMDMASGSRLDEEEFRPFAQATPSAGRVLQPTPQMELQLGLQMVTREVTREFVRRPLLREPPLDAEQLPRVVYLH